MEYEINGGVNTITGDVEWLEAHGGVLYVKGKVGTLVHHGGVMYDQRPSNRVEYRTDKMSDEERWKYKRQIEELQRRVDRSERECLKLREKLGKQELEQPTDDVLVARIEHLQNELKTEREERKRETDDLRWRLRAVMDELIETRKEHLEAVRCGEGISVDDEMFDVLFTFINLYPFTTDSDLAFEYGIKVEQVRYIAKILKLAKSTEARREAVDYLRKQHLEFIQRRGGDQGNHNPGNCKAVERVSRNGRVTATYKSIADAANHNGSTSKTIQRYCNSKKTIYTKDGVTFRWKKDDNTTKQSGGH